MERAASLAHDDTLQAKLDKLDALLALTSTSVEDAALLAEMLSLANDGPTRLGHWTRSSDGKEHWKRSSRKSRHSHAKIRC